MAAISFVCPLFNKAPYLPGVVEALGRQALSHDRQFIFIDDGSSDGSLDIVRDLTRDWPNCEYRYQENRGPAVATNAGFALATGDYIKLLGSDDVLAPYATDTLLRAMEATGAVGIYAEQYYYRTPEDIVFSTAPDLVVPEILADPIGYAIRPGLAGTSQTLFRAAAVREVGGCDERVFVEDYSLVLRLARIGRLALLPLTAAWGPADDPNRLMVGRNHQTLHDYSLSLALFLTDRPELKRRYGKQALRVAAGRAEKWARREAGDETERWRLWRLRLSSYLPLPGFDHAAHIFDTLPTFHTGDAARRRAIVRPRKADEFEADEI